MEQVIRSGRITSGETYSQVSHAVRTWSEVSTALLKAVFSTNEKAVEFDRAGVRMVFFGGATLQDNIQELLEELEEKVRKLSSYEAQIRRGLFEGPAASAAPSPKAAVPAGGGGGVFIVHGHDLALREATARLLKTLDLDFVILGEEPNKSRSIIEKLEDEGGRADYAVILLSADDEGRKKATHPKNENDLLPRARQNVVLELGWFFSKLTRRRVAILYEPGVELPSDAHGITYIQVDAEWRWKLAKELKAAGFEVDMNKVA